MAGRGKLIQAISKSLIDEVQANPLDSLKQTCQSVSVAKCGSGRGRLIEALANQSPVPALSDLVLASQSGCLIQFEDSISEPNSSQSTFQEHPTLSQLSTQKEYRHQDIPALAPDSIIPIIQPPPPSEAEPIEVVTNFIKLNREENYDVFLYVVEFQPPLDDRKAIRQILESELIQKRLKTKPFMVGSKFYLPQLIESFELYHIPHPQEKCLSMKMIVTFIKQVPLRDQVVLYNFLFKKIMNTLNYSFMKTKYFDENQTIDLEEWMMEIWPGYALDVVQVGPNELMLLCDISHRVLHKTNVYDHLKLLMPNLRYKQVACRHLLGTSVITLYNKQTYRVDDIDFDSTPFSTFKWGNIVVSYMEYFKKHWGFDIKIHDQPLLVHRKYMPKTNSHRLIYLVPELCNMTGLNMIQDRNVFLKIIAHVQPPPNMRYHKLMQYIELVNRNSEASFILKSWGLKLERTSHTTTAEKYPEEMIISNLEDTNSYTRHRFLQTKTLPQNWSHLLRHAILNPVAINNKWMIVFMRKDKSHVEMFVRACRKYAKTMAIELQLPRLVPLLTSNTDDYLKAIKHNFENDDKIIVVVTPGNVEIKQRYDSIKQFCTIQLGIPTQFMRAATIAQPRKLETICPNILVQMTCKIGGSPWGIQMPLKNVMYIGIDIYHRKNIRKKSVIGFVASMNSNATRWFSKAYIKEQDTSDICDESLIEAITEALYKYRVFNECLPTFIIIYRDDVGIPIEKLCKIEYQMLMNAIRDVYMLDAAVVDGTKGYEDFSCDENGNVMPYVVFLTVAKRISVKLFLEDNDDSEDTRVSNLSTPPPKNNIFEESYIEEIFDDDPEPQTSKETLKLIDFGEEEVIVKDRVKNVPSGTVLTQNTERFDQFYLVSQKVSKTCACPIRIRVLRNTASYRGQNPDKPEVLTTQYLQSLSYKLCYLYFNTASICRQPAPGMYAHKVANFVGEHLEAAANEDLEDKLFYL